MQGLQKLPRTGEPRIGRKFTPTRQGVSAIRTPRGGFGGWQPPACGGGAATLGETKQVSSFHFPTWPLEVSADYEHMLVLKSSRVLRADALEEPHGT